MRLKILLALSFATLQVFAQDKKTEAFFQKGIEAFKQRDYTEARIWFLRTIEKDSLHAESFFRLGQIAESAKKKVDTENFYKKAIALDSTNKNFVRAYSYLGALNLENQKFDESLKYLEKAKFLTSPQSIVYKQYENQIARANFAKVTMASPLKILPQRMSKTINFKQKQYFPVFTADGRTLFFTARNENSDEDIFYSRVEQGVWDIPMPISPNINSPFNEGTCSVSANGRFMVFTSCERTENIGSCDLYYSKKEGDEWSLPKNMGKNINSPFWDSQASLSSDGKTLYFSSDRPESKGKKDIFFSKMDEQGNWSKAQNAGESINTVYDEVSPFIHANGHTLFFASQGHIGLGGFDLYMSKLQKGKFSSPFNLGYPINTNLDQFAIYIAADGRNAFYSVEKGDSVNLFQFRIPKELNEKFDPTFFIKGRISGSDNQSPIKASLQLVNVEEQEVISRFENQPDTGDFIAVVPTDGSYALYIESPDYFFKSVPFDVSREGDIANENLDIVLSKIEKNKSETLNQIYFDTGKWELLDESKIELIKLLSLIKQNPNLKVEISGHTDNVGTAEANQMLSEKRATAVIEYLINHGIDKNRLKAVGYGETQPKESNDTEKGRAQNRRIELKFN